MIIARQEKSIVSLQEIITSLTNSQRIEEDIHKQKRYSVEHRSPLRLEVNDSDGDGLN